MKDKGHTKCVWQSEQQFFYLYIHTDVKSLSPVKAKGKGLVTN